MSGIFDQIINYSPPLIVSGTVNYKGTWNASTNNPTLNNPPAASTKGDYYVVSTAGTQFSITFGVGDWIISNGTAWEKVDLTDAVHSVFGRTGAVVGDSTDYSAVGLTNTAIGAANPAAGSFTTLGSSSTTTLNGTTIPASSTLLVSGGALGAPASGTLTSCTGLPISTGVSGLGTGIATALAVNTGSAGAPVLFNGALGTPSSGTVTNLTGTASININGTVGATTPNTVAATTITAQNASFQIVAQTSGSTRMTLDHNGTNGRVGTLDAQDVYIVRANVPVAVFGSTGLNSTAIGATAASTGAFTTLAASGQITSTATGEIFRAVAASATDKYGTISNTNGSLEFGVNAAGNSFFSASSGDQLLLAVAGTPYATISSTGLAVTGALSATGEIASFGSSGGVNNRLKASYNSGSGVAVFGPDSNGGTTSLNIGVSNAGTYNTVLGISTTGLAVTGALSSTGALAIGNTVATAVSVASTHKVTIVIGGVTYYLLATNV